MLKGYLFRLKDDGKATLGVLQLYDQTEKMLELKTLELPWKNNQKKMSCIPKGKYWCEPRKTAKYGNHFHVQNVPDREMILIHAFNFVSQTEGCIGVGWDYADINKDGIWDITKSKLALEKLVEMAPNGFELNIV